MAAAAAAMAEIAAGASAGPAAALAGALPPCDLLEALGPRLPQWLGPELLARVGDGAAECGYLFAALEAVAGNLGAEFNNLAWRHWLRKRLVLEESIANNANPEFTFGTTKYQCIFVELQRGMRMFSEVADFLGGLSILRAQQCFFAELRVALARFVAAVAAASAAHARVLFHAAWWGALAKPGGTVTRDFSAVDSVIGSLQQAAGILDLRQLSGLLRGEGMLLPLPPDFHGDGGAFSEMVFLDRKLAGDSGWYLDRGLLLGLVRLIPDGATVGDLGAGAGHYSEFLNATGHYVALAFDGAEDAAALTSGRVQHARLDKPGLWLGRRFDWVLCLEVAEHVPAEGQQPFLENLARHAEHGLILSWSLHPDEHPGSDVHPNAKASLEDVEQTVLVSIADFILDSAAGERLRELATVPWLKESVSVFRRVAAKSS